MNNQVKLIDADKLLKWIESNDKAEAFWIDGLDSTIAFDNLSDAIDAGELSPDTPPVPTIKPGEQLLPEWLIEKLNNEHTILHYSGEKYRIVSEIVAVEKVKGR